MTRRSVVAVFAFVVAIVAPAAAAVAQGPLEVVNVQKTANAPATLSEGSECATFLQDVQKSPKNFKIASMQEARSFCGGCNLSITYTLDGVDGSGDPAEIIVTCREDD